MSIKDYFTFKPFLSEIDQFLQQLRVRDPRLSASQLAEKKKYERIFSRRDHAKNQGQKANHTKAQATLCEDFLNN